MNIAHAVISKNLKKLDWLSLASLTSLDKCWQVRGDPIVWIAFHVIT